MSDEPSPGEALPPTNPMVAYAADVARLGRASIGAQDDAWLTLAHTFASLATLTNDERRATMPTAADALAAATVAVGLPTSAPVLEVASALHALYPTGESGDSGQPDASSALVFAVQSAVEELEIAGGFALAFATLTNCLTAFEAVMPPRVRGILGAQQARTLRQLGLNDLARDMYTATMELGYACDAKDVISRGQLGLAIVATTRGNYPAARDLYERALANAEAGRENDVMRAAHHGLMNCGFVSGDLDAAMVHGWNVLRLCIHPDARAEALMNMGEVCRMAGELEVALRVFLVAKEWTSIPRVRLHATSSAMLAAAKLTQVDMARRLFDELSEQVRQVGDTYAIAGARLERAETLYLLDDRAEARTELAAAHALCVAREYHEFTYRAEQLQQQWDAAEAAEADAAHSATPVVSLPPEPRRSRRSEHYTIVLRSLRNLTSVSL